MIFWTATESVVSLAVFLSHTEIQPRFGLLPKSENQRKETMLQFWGDSTRLKLSPQLR